ncbi:MAG: amidohydrolase family protein [Planctomycetota bacterium]
MTTPPLKIDAHTHILPQEWPDWASEFGYGDGRFVVAELGEEDGAACMRMLRGGELFRRVWPNCYSPQRVLSDMDRFGVDVQVMCTVPVMFSYWTKPAHGVEIARFLNDDLAQTCRGEERFVGLGTLPLQDPVASVEELKRCKEELGFPGVQIGSHVEPSEWNGIDKDVNLSDPALMPVFEAANELDMAILVHPWEMMGFHDMRKYWLPWLVGMPAETCRAVCAMIFGGVFEKCPALRVCFAHGGGTFPTTIGRIEHGFNTRPDLVAIDCNVNPRTYLGRFWVDSAVHDPYALKVLLDVIGEDKIVMGSDYPFPLGEHEPGQLIETMPGISDATRAKMLGTNTLEWLGIKAPAGVRTPSASQ